VHKDITGSSPQNSKELQLVLADSYSGVEHSEFRVIRDSKTLKHFFLQINRTRKPGLPIPEVDFGKELLLIYCSGITLGVGEVGLCIIEDSRDDIVVGLKEGPLSEQQDQNVTTTPFCIYRMPLTPKKISFQKKK
jgi:hypothetical protein